MRKKAGGTLRVRKHNEEEGKRSTVNVGEHNEDNGKKGTVTLFVVLNHFKRVL